ncbi:hypothetical protein Acr_27g0000240 [Actinidia rufa]|uniref:Uncharacterized protein n=1 Tax=Actinidia rufa TaxID=165716 RepID=A0A7J0H5Q2_9ERIC|nr:hypothetical protein Acr_27g0000240 [Actinidia rufa]
MTSLTSRDLVAAAEAGVLRVESVANSHDGEKTAMATTASFHSTSGAEPDGVAAARSPLLHHRPPLSRILL